ncbi:MAG: dTDP-4-dehydrorhamnose 3,5-epimerase family protein [Candidatus Omnitrophica bacterium]|nr:dTDP-4-dehydrorhamnose 3,5-epimerase family protein [Candidatus Omnitrophota bacterium]
MIDGVKLIPLKKFSDDRGYLIEILRNDDPHFQQFGQIYVSKLRRGIIKAWHKHIMQTDHFYVVSGTSKIGLYDDREGSPTQGQYQTVILGDDGETALLAIPPMVWHGQMSLSDATMLINLPTESYDRQNPDEIRAAVEDFEDVWSINNR